MSRSLNLAVTCLAFVAACTGTSSTETTADVPMSWPGAQAVTEGETTTPCPEPPPDVIVHPTAADRSLDARAWFRVDAAALRDAAASAHPADIDPGRLVQLAGTDPDSAATLTAQRSLIAARRSVGNYDDWLANAAVADLLATRSDVGPALVTVNGADQAGVGLIRHVFVADGDGALTVIGQCRDAQIVANAIFGFAAAAGAPSAAAVVERLATDDEAVAALREWLDGGVVRWSELTDR